MFDIAGIHQLRVQPVRLEQVEHRLPVVAGGFHHHSLDTKINQVIGQLGQRSGHRRMGGHLLQSFLCARAGRNPHTAHDLRLADIQGSDPGDDLFLIADSVNIACSPYWLATTTYSGGRQVGIAREKQNLILVLDDQRHQ
jgi:hypothetical protein